MDSHTLFQTKWISRYYFRPDGGTINRLISLLHLLFIVTSCYFHFVNFPRCFFHYVIFEICDHTYCINDNPNQNEAYAYAQQYFKPKGTTMSPPPPSPTWNALKYSLWVCPISFTSPCRFLMCWSLVCMEVCNTVMCCCWLDWWAFRVSNFVSAAARAVSFFATSAFNDSTWIIKGSS